MSATKVPTNALKEYTTLWNDVTVLDGYVYMSPERFLLFQKKLSDDRYGLLYKQLSLLITSQNIKKINAEGLY